MLDAGAIVVTGRGAMEVSQEARQRKTRAEERKLVTKVTGEWRRNGAEGAVSAARRGGRRGTGREA